MSLAVHSIPQLDTRVFIVTASYNRRDVARLFCECLERQTFKNFTLVFVDDGSTDGTSGMVEGRHFAKVVCTGNGSLWWAGGLRKGIARVASLHPRKHDLVLLINTDTTFGDAFLENAVREAALLGAGTMMSVPARFTDTNDSSSGCVVCYWPRFTFHDYGRRPERIDCASTRCLFLFYSDMEKCGTFRPRLVRHYLSDFEFTIRAHRRGVRILPARSVVCQSTEKTTGVHRLPKGSFREVLRYMLSPGFSANPVTLFMFVLLAAPIVWKPACWLWAARTSLAFMFRALILHRLFALSYRK
jgi:GT2 family glycosyltransferase